MNANNEFQAKPGSKARIESRKDVLSRKSNINKNSFYRSKAIGKLPEFLPNKATVIGSRGGLPAGVSSPGYGKDVSSKGDYQPTVLPSLNSGIAANNKSLGNKGLSYQPVYKYGSGLGGGIGGIGGLSNPSPYLGGLSNPNPYQMNYQQNA